MKIFKSGGYTPSCYAKTTAALYAAVIFMVALVGALVVVTASNEASGQTTVAEDTDFPYEVVFIHPDPTMAYEWRFRDDINSEWVAIQSAPLVEFTGRSTVLILPSATGQLESRAVDPATGMSSAPVIISVPEPPSTVLLLSGLDAIERIAEVASITEIASIVKSAEAARDAEIAEIAGVVESGESAKLARATRVAELAALAEIAAIAEAARTAEIAEIAAVTASAGDVETAEIAEIARIARIAQIARIAEIAEIVNAP